LVYFSSWAALFLEGFINKHLAHNGINLSALVFMNFSKVFLQFIQKCQGFAFLTVSLGFTGFTELITRGLIERKNLTENLCGNKLVLVQE
jgi:hypothetical protein